jgi:hydrogenase maturation protein HypF
MLPYSPLHRLLLDEDDIFIATSANSSSLPLTYRNEDARRDLSQIVDAFLMHNRGIHVPVEDSVVMADAEQIRPIRRSRGYAPLPVFLGEADRCILAVGAELKNTFALTRDGMAFLSAHIGDMGSLETQQAYEKSVAQMLTAHRRTPELIVVDKHPGYATHAWGYRQGEKLGVPVLEVQHHHAHALSLLAENHLTGAPMTFAVLDGTGYGDDGTIWGGEILTLGEDPLNYERRWHLPGFWLPGGDSAIRHPWKSAMGLLWEYGVDLPPWPETIPGAPKPEELDLVESQLRNQVAVARTSSTGRLFDAVSSILGVCHLATYEGQAAMELERVARTCPHTHGEPVTSIPDLLALLMTGARDSRPIECLARIFHVGLATVLAHELGIIEVEPTQIGLTGGVFANRLLGSDLARELASQGHRALHHRIVPANDGGLALGQALAGHLYAERVR